MPTAAPCPTAQLNPCNAAQMVENLEPMTFAAGDVIFREGEAGEAFYVVQSGEVKCTVNGQEVARILAGGIFGERALIKNEACPRMSRP